MRKSKEIVKVDFPKSVTEVGELVSIIYKKKGNGKKRYIHTFDRLPILYVSNTGKQIILAGGNFKYGKRGFVEKGK